jgi:NAD-dependent DNA ligase
VFFDDRETSETYTEWITHCPACGQQLERKNLEEVMYPV